MIVVREPLAIQFRMTTKPLTASVIIIIVGITDSRHNEKEKIRLLVAMKNRLWSRREVKSTKGLLQNLKVFFGTVSRDENVYSRGWEYFGKRNMSLDIHSIKRHENDCIPTFRISDHRLNQVDKSEIFIKMRVIQSMKLQKRMKAISKQIFGCGKVNKSGDTFFNRKMRVWSLMRRKLLEQFLKLLLAQKMNRSH